MTTGKHIRPAWKMNLLVIATLIGVMLGYYYWQLKFGENTFRRHVLDHTQMVAGVIRLNIGREELSREVVEEVIRTFLGNAARFVDYLDTVEPFSPDELAAFSREAGLAGICISDGRGAWITGPDGWLEGDVPCTPEGRLTQTGADGLYALAVPRMETDGCIIVGMLNARIRDLRQQISLSRLLAMLPGLAGIRYVRFEPQPGGPGGDDGLVSIPIVKIMGRGSDMVAEGRLDVGGRILVIGLEARHFGVRMQQLRMEFISFSIILAILGGIFTWALHHYQSAYLNQVRRYERQLAREKEDASLGRASAAITHEIRNPLNAISMGLQRLQIEADSLDPEHRDLLAALRQAVDRTDGIIRRLRRYARPIAPEFDTVSLDDIVSHIVDLYGGLCQDRGIRILKALETHRQVRGDSGLLEEVVENLMKNAVEASPRGETISICLEERHGRVALSMDNAGFESPKSGASEILEPYYTTKTQGSGLGLSIAGRIIRAHEGQITVTVPGPGRIRVHVFLPVAGQGLRRGPFT